jgi:hypothetical protein
MTSRQCLRAQRCLWSVSLVVAGYAMLPYAAAAAGPLDPLTTPIASILASLPVRTPTPLPTVKLPVDTPDPTVRLPTLPLPTPLPTVKLPTAVPTLPTPLPTTTLPLPTPTLPLPTPSLPIATPTASLPAIPPSPGPTSSPTPSASPSEIPGIGGIGDPGNPFTPEGGVSSITGPHNGIFGALPELGIPVLIVGLPALALLLVLLAQGAVAAAWLPVVRRFMGGFGAMRKR